MPAIEEESSEKETSEKSDKETTDEGSDSIEKTDDVGKDTEDDDEPAKQKKTVAIAVEEQTEEEMANGTLRKRQPPPKFKKHELKKQYSSVSIFSGMNMDIASVVSTEAASETSKTLCLF